MIKKYTYVILTILTTALLGACGSSKTDVKGTESKTSSVESVIAEQIAAKEGQVVVREPEEMPEKTVFEEEETAVDWSSIPEPEEIPEDVVLSTTEGIDVDLTILSSTMVYSEVYQMMYYPKEYIGKVIRMEGMYTDYDDPDTGEHYDACIISDATACCSQGIEFQLTSAYSYPEDYPSFGDTVTVTGTFNTYEEEGVTYATLEGAELTP